MRHFLLIKFDPLRKTLSKTKSYSMEDTIEKTSVLKLNKSIVTNNEEVNMEDNDNISISTCNVEKKLNPLGLDHKKFSVSFFSICKTALFNFTAGNYAVAKLVLLCTIILVKNISNTLYTYRMANLEAPTKYEQRIFLFYGAILQSVVFTFNYFLDWMFECHQNKYGGVMNLVCLNNIFNCNDPNINNASPSKLEHFITKGCMAMAKTSKSVIMEIPSKFVHIACDTTMIFIKDKSSYKAVFMIFTAGALLVVLIKIYLLNLSIKHIRQLNLASAERTRLMHQILEKNQIIKLYGCDKEYLNEAKKANKRWCKYKNKEKFTYFTGEFAYKAISMVYQVGVCLVFLHLFSKSSGANTTALTLTILFKFVTDTIRTNEKVSQVFKDLSESIAEAEMVMLYLNLMQEDVGSKVKIQTDKFRKIELRDISFSIKGRGNNNESLEILKDVNLEFSNNERVVICGRNGSGKSTLFKILLNLIHFKGQVQIDGILNTHITRRSLCELITLVPQNTNLMEGTILFNIQLYNKVSYEECVEICKELNIHDVIMSLPQNYSYQVGMDGKNLNGGLRQKIFYARALLRNSPIFLFDEPTNNLDEKHMKQFVDFILNSRRLQNKLVITICHQLEHHSKFDRTLYFKDKGKGVSETPTDIFEE